MLSLIACMDENRAIGKGGKIPWKVEGEQKHFRQVTQGKPVIMGRRTFEEIGHPLLGRENIVVSTTQNFSDDHLTTVQTFEQALELVEGKDAFVIGGTRLYEKALPLVDEMFLTHLRLKVQNPDTFFPEFNESDFEVLKKTLFIVRDLQYEIKHYRRIFPSVENPRKAWCWKKV